MDEEVLESEEVLGGMLPRDLADLNELWLESLEGKNLDRVEVTEELEDPTLDRVLCGWSGDLAIWTWTSANSGFSFLRPGS